MFDDTGIVEYEIEREKWNDQPETNFDAIQTKSGYGGCGCLSLKAFLLFFAGMMLFRLFGDVLKFIF